jgi:hypothetical protein
VPLGFCFGGFSSTAGYDPATKLNFRRAACPLWRVLFQRVPLVSERLEKVSQLSPAEPFGSDSGVIGLTAACFSSQPMRHRIGHRPFVGLEGRDPRDTCFIPQRIFTVNFLCVLFFIAVAKKIFFRRRSRKRRILNDLLLFLWSLTERKSQKFFSSLFIFLFYDLPRDQKNF